MNVERTESGFRWGEKGALYTFEVGDDRGMELAFKKAVRDGVLAAEVPEDETARAVARAMAGRLGVRKDAGGHLIVAWWLPPVLAMQLAIPGGEAASDMHLTLLYLGDPAAYDVELVAACAKLNSVRASKVEGVIGGMGRFVGEGDADIIVALVDVPGLDSLRRNLLDDLQCYGALKESLPADHGYVPHITLGYISKISASPPPLAETIPIVIDNLTVASGEGRASFAIEGGTDPEDAEPELAYYAAKTASAAEKVDKAGRVLSATNLQKVEDALSVLQALADTERARMKDDEEAEQVLDAVVGEDDPLEYKITKSIEEDRYTLGPLYAPDRKDAHGEWTDPATLQKAVWGYVRESSDSGRRLNLQHGDAGEVTVGEWVEVMAWPYEHTIKVSVPGQDERELTMPAGTVYMGVVWDEESWPLVKAGKLAGYSLGGKAVKVATPDVEHGSMGDKTP